MPRRSAASAAAATPPSPAADSLANRLVRWQATHGRHDLPWQATRDPYRVWLSEIMLQQTQVATVLGYYARFLERFPDVAALAAAPLDEVLGLWSGLGYYSRARNLHACARAVVAQHGGNFPRSAELLQTLPGIGRSTAAAVASICFGERVAILDGNVKRVLTRALGFDGDLAQSANEKALWQRAQDLLPTENLQVAMPRYTQAVMDLGASLCSVRKPACLLCPLADVCVAHAQGQSTAYPVKTRKLKRSAQSLWMLWATAGHGKGAASTGKVWLAQRPTPGVWAGLYCFELFDSREALAASLPASSVLDDLPAFKHVLTHKDLHLHPVRVQVAQRVLRPRSEGQWFSAAEWPALGLPAPVRKLLASG